MIEGSDVAHDTGSLHWGTWLCDCDGCQRLCLEFPEVTLIIKSSEGRFAVPAGKLAEHGAEAFLSSPTDYVREVFVAQNQ